MISPCVTLVIAPGLESLRLGHNPFQHIGRIGPHRLAQFHEHLDRGIGLPPLHIIDVFARHTRLGRKLLLGQPRSNPRFPQFVL